MADSNPRVIPDPLTQVVEAFNHWRGPHGRRGRIPNDLWDQAIALADHYPLATITAALGLDSCTFKQQCVKRGLPTCKARTPTFVEVIAAPPEQQAHRFSLQIELLRQDGATLRLQGADPRLALQCLAQFLRG